ARDEARAPDRLVVLERGEALALPLLPAHPGDAGEGEPARDRHPAAEIRLHGEDGGARSRQLVLVLAGQRPAEVAAQRQPRGELDGAVEEGALALDGGELAADGVARVA